MAANKRQKMSPSVFPRYLHSHLLVFILPLILSLALFMYYTNLYKTEIVRYHYEQSHQLAMTLDIYMEQVQNAVLMVSTDPTLSSSRMGNSMNQIHATEALRTIMLSCPLINEMYYYQRNLDKVISTRMVMEIRDMEKFHLLYPQWPIEELLTDIYNNPLSSWRSFESVTKGLQKNSNIITGIYPLTSLDQYNASVLLVQIEKSQFERLMGIDHLINGTFSIYTADGRCLYQYGDNPVLPVTLESKEFSSFPYSYIKDGYLINVFASTYNNWYYVHSFPLRNALGNLTQVYIILFSFMLLSLPLGYIITYVMARKSYQPVKELKSIINSKDLAIAPTQDEFGQAKYAINYLNDLKDFLQTQLEISKAQAKEGLLLQLLKGQISSIEEFNAKGCSCGIALQGQMIFAAAIARENANWTEEQFTELLQANQYGCHLLEFQGDKYQVYLCAVDHGRQNQIPDDFAAFAKTLQEISGTPVFIGISQPTTNITNSYQCCVESLVAMGHARLTKESVYVFSRDEYRYTLHYPSSELTMLRESIRARNQMHFANIYNAICEYISNLESTSLVRSCICFEVISILLQAVLEYNKNVFPLDLLERYAAHYLRGTVGNPEVLSEVMDMLYFKVCTFWKEESEKPVDPIVRIKSFIEQHYCDLDFSVAMIAEREGMSLSALSAYFKKETKMTPSQYIETLKMNLAANLLLQSDLPINEIANAAAYTSTSSFIRKFRQYMGITPGEYRRIYSQQQKENSIDSIEKDESDGISTSIKQEMFVLHGPSSLSESV